MKRKIPFKNYIALLLIVIATILLVFSLSNWYKESKRQKHDVLKNLLSEIKEEELESYLLENPNAIIYLMNDYTKDDSKIKNYIVDNDLKNRIILIDCTETKIDLSKYNKKKEVVIPNFVIFEEGKVSKVMHLKETQVNYKTFKAFMDVNGENDA